MVNTGAGPAAFESDVLFVVALAEELEAARGVPMNGFLQHPGVAHWTESDESDSVPYIIGRFVISDEVGFTVALSDLPRMGGDAAARVLGTLIERLKPACLAMSGVCAGRPGEVALGDVIIAEPVYQPLEGKMTSNGLRADVRTYSPSSRWVRAARGLVVNNLDRFRLPTKEESKQWVLECLFTKRDPLEQPDRERYLDGEGWRDVIRELTREGLISVNDSGIARLSPSGRTKVQRTRRENPDWPGRLPFRVIVGPMASGPYVDASNPWSVLTSNGVRTVIGLEMEAAAVGSAAHANDMPYWIVGKGVMDHATHHKEDRYKTFAAYASAQVVWKFLVEQCLKHPETVLRSKSRGSGCVPGRAPFYAALPESNLPEPIDSFVGRDRKFDECRGYLSQGSRLLTIVGPPGAGKTRLATEVARSVGDRLEGRVYLVDLSVVSDPDLVFASITESLRIEAGDPLIDALRELFRDTPALIILDNFVQVAPAARRVADLLRVAPDLAIIVTSQGPLHLRGEKTVDVGPLDTVAAEELFVSRAAVSMASPAARDSVSELCRLLDGLPLAIEIVAAHAAVLTPQHISKVGDASDFIHLKNLLQDASTRQETVESAIRWSFERLDAQQRDLFIRLAVFDGGWTSAAAARIVGALPETMLGADLMRQLLDRRFVYVDDPDDPEPRFRMLAPLREFGMEALFGRRDLVDELTSRHADYFRDFVLANAAKLNGTERANGLSLLARDHANVHAALEHFVSAHDFRSAVSTAVALDPYWWSRNYKEGFLQLVAVLALAVPGDASRQDRTLRARANFAAGKLALRQFRLDDARLYFSEVRSIAVAEGDRGLEAAGLEREALVDIEQHLYDDARRKLELALQVDNAEGDDHHAADCLDGLGIVACEAGTYERAASKFAEAIDRYPLSAGLQPRAWVRMDLAQATLLLGRRTEARQHARYAHDVGTSHGDLGLMMWAEHSLALLDVLDGDFDQARANLTQSLTRAMLLGNLRPRLRALEGFAILAAAAGQPESALTLIAALDSIRHQIGLRRAETEYAMISPALESSRAVLSGAAQIRATDSGAQKTLEQATEFAREI